MAVARARVSRVSAFSYPSSQGPSSYRVIRRRPGDTCALCERSSELREPKSFIMGSKHECSLLKRETLSLHSGAVHGMNIIKKSLEQRVTRASACKMYKELMENFLPAIP